MVGLTRWLMIAMLGVGAGGCTSQLPLDNSPCPCPASLGYVCCDRAGTRSCIRPTAGESCSSNPLADAGSDVVDQGVDAGSDTDVSVDARNDAPGVKARWDSLAIGRAHACVLRDDNSITCVGDNSKGQGDVPPGQYSGVAAGGDVTCGTLIDKSDFNNNGKLVCWGDNAHGQASPPPEVKYLSTLGGQHGCGLQSDATTVVCWGDNSHGQATPPAGRQFFGMVAGRNHTCGLEWIDRTAYTERIVCWGDNSLGQTVPPDLQVHGLVNMAAGGDHTCIGLGPGVGGEIWCWGDHSSGQSTPPSGAFSSLAVAAGHACAIDRITSKVVCWGNEWGDNTPIPPGGQFNNVFGSDYRMCAWMNDGSGLPPICWGRTYEPWD